MDALQLLGSLLGNNATSSNTGNQILNQLVSSLTRGTSPTASNTGGRTDIASLLGKLAITALQSFTQRSSSVALSQSPLAALAGTPGGSSQSPPAAAGLGGGLGSDIAQANQQALVLAQAMINAAKADGQIDEEEQQKIIAKLSDLGPQEVEFVRTEMAKPLNLNFLANLDPAIATEVYAVSLMAINVDTIDELNYLQQLAQHLGLDIETVNGIHGQLGLSPLYAV